MNEVRQLSPPPQLDPDQTNLYVQTVNGIKIYRKQMEIYIFIGLRRSKNKLFSYDNIPELTTAIRSPHSLESLKSIYQETDYVGVVLDDFLFDQLFKQTSKSPDHFPTAIIRGATCIYNSGKLNTYSCHLPFNWTKKFELEPHAFAQVLIKGMAYSEHRGIPYNCSGSGVEKMYFL